jgi:outer membrane lipoprotein-sorting protein
MIKRISIYISIIFTAFMLISCTGSKETERELSRMQIREIKNKVNRNFNLIQSLEASGTISFDSPEMSNTGSIDVKIRKPDTVYVKIEGPFGISIASALITRKDFIYYNAQENRAIMGPTTENNIDAILRIKVSFDELINSFSGSFHFIEQTGDSLDARSEDNSYIIESSDVSGISKYLVQPISFAVNSYNVYDPGGKLMLEIYYSKYTVESISGSDVNFPNSIKINKPDKKQTVWLDYDSKEINKKNITFKIKIPKSAKLIKWE